MIGSQIAGEVKLGQGIQHFSRGTPEGSFRTKEYEGKVSGTESKEHSALHMSGIRVFTSILGGGFPDVGRASNPNPQVFRSKSCRALIGG